MLPKITQYKIPKILNIKNCKMNEIIYIEELNKNTRT